MKILTPLPENRPKLKVALLDFDGTLSTLRNGWESVMKPLMLEMIAGDTPVDDALITEVEEYIDQSTGIQTIYQMRWLAETVEKYGRNPVFSKDPWWYKNEYNDRLMKNVSKRIDDVRNGVLQADDYLMKGSIELLEGFKRNGVIIYVASGTDDPDVKKEAEYLSVKKYFKEIAGAPVDRADCSKEAVLRRLVSENNLQGNEVVVIGDGKVEIALGREVGALTLGIASNEDKRYGVNPVKSARLEKAGAHAIVGDFENTSQILNWLGLEE